MSKQIIIIIIVVLHALALGRWQYETRHDDMRRLLSLFCGVNPIMLASGFNANFHSKDN